MQRFIDEKLKKWKESTDRKPLIINGARQVGKTWLMRSFGEKNYKKVCYVNFDREKNVANLFGNDIRPISIIKGLEREYNIEIDAKDTLIIFDEIQECKRALSSLKYFCEDAPEYHIMCAGSYMGIALHEGMTFPVGKVDILKLYPMTYEEFLCATGNEKMYELLISDDNKMIEMFATKYLNILKDYFYVGGMPEVVDNFANNYNYIKAREIQDRILDNYKRDISKHCILTQLPKIDMVFDSIPMQLSKDNKKFIYSNMKKGARANDFEYALCYLSDIKVINKIYRVKTPKVPLRFYNDLNSFKVYMLDVGLLNAMAGLDSSTLNDNNNLFVEYKGALAEQYVAQTIIATYDNDLYYFFSDEGRTEVDFMMSDGKNVFPIEVKASSNIVSKSLKYYVEKFRPEKAMRISTRNYKDEGKYVNIPLYNLNLLKKYM